MNFILSAFLAGLMTWLITALGAGVVIFYKKYAGSAVGKTLGFSAGVMLASSFWSLLEPSVNDYSYALTLPVWVGVSLSFALGAFMILAVDRAGRIISSHANVGENRGLFLMILGITAHNIPEGLAVGVAFGALSNGYSREALIGAVSVAVGIGIQNFPEGAAVSLPMRQKGFSRTKSFFAAQATALVEPIFAVAGAVCASRAVSLLPLSLSFAAGNMITVCAHEVIPECKTEGGGYSQTVWIIIGFVIMTVLDLAFG